VKKIGVFDSGVGGLSVVNAIKTALPNCEVIFINDVVNLPYGSKTPEELKVLAKPHIDYLQDQKCDVIVIACNTLSTTVILEMKSDYHVPIVAMVPMVKPACAMTKTRKVAVFATPTTLASKRYTELKTEFGEGIEFLEPFCGDWAKMIETNTLNTDKVHATVGKVCEQGADVIVLGCTHYHWIEEIIVHEAAGRALVIQPEQAIVERVRSILYLGD